MPYVSLKIENEDIFNALMWAREQNLNTQVYHLVASFAASSPDFQTYAREAQAQGKAELAMFALGLIVALYKIPDLKPLEEPHEGTGTN